MAKKVDTAPGGYKWSFMRIGGVDQVVLRNGDDIAHIPHLDQKLWAALAMPKRAMGFDLKRSIFWMPTRMAEFVLRISAQPSILRPQV